MGQAAVRSYGSRDKGAADSRTGEVGVIRQLVASRDYRNLQGEIRRLRKQLLPVQFDPLGRYPPAIQTRTRAFLVLSHAAIESYLEEEPKRIVRKAEELWKNTGKIVRPIAFLLAHRAQALSSPSGTANYCPEADIATVLPPILIEFYTLVRKNNGIKEHNVAELFFRIGIERSAFGTSLLPDLSSLGSDRGEHAHGGSRVVQYLDPEDTWDKVNGVVNDLEQLDAELREYAKFRR